MVKIHTKSKRAMKLRSTTRKHRFWFTRVVAKPGHKSFPSKEKAETWAKDRDMSGKVLLQLKNKFQWRPKGRV